jgi:hypothetical protein
VLLKNSWKTSETKYTFGFGQSKLLKLYLFSLIKTHTFIDLFKQKNKIIPKTRQKLFSPWSHIWVFKTRIVSPRTERLLYSSAVTSQFTQTTSKEIEGTTWSKILAKRTL